ncbi:MAG: LysR family transcriptional regulator, partial [Pseudomonadota bacterium]
MLIRQLTYLIALAKAKHFGRAAAACCVTQSTLSAGLKALERDLDMQLVVRTHRFKALTPEGERVVEWARRMVADYDNLKQEVGSLKSGLSGQLRLGVVPAATPMVAQLTVPFRQRHPQVTVEITTLPSAEIKTGLDRYELDGGLTYLDDEPLSAVRSVVFYEERYLFMTHKDNVLLNGSALTWAEAVQHPLCLLHEGMQNRRILNRIAASRQLVLQPSVTANTFLAIFSHVATG